MCRQTRCENGMCGCCDSCVEEGHVARCAHGVQRCAVCDARLASLEKVCDALESELADMGMRLIVAQEQHKADLRTAEALGRMLASGGVHA
jgi:hypothetical protein